MMETIVRICGIGLMIDLAVCDHRSKKIPFTGLLGFLLLGLLRQYLWDRTALIGETMIAVWILLCGILARMAAHKGVGSGDLWLFTSMPFWLKGESLVLVYAIPFFSACIYYLVRYGWKNRAMQFAFVPWIAAAFTVLSICIMIR